MDHRRPRSIVLVATLLWLAGCAEPPAAPMSGHRTSFPVAGSSTSVLPAGVEPCGDPTETDLMAGRDETVGTLTIANDADTIYVTYALEPGWTLRNTHLEVASAVADVPTTSSGNPIIGHFSYGSERVDDRRVTYAVALADLGAEPGDGLVVAAHADVYESSTRRTEGAWGAGSPFPDASNWATYTIALVQECATALVCTGNNPSAVVTFADANLETHVRLALGQRPDATLPLTCRQVTSIAFLNVRRTFFIDPVEDLSGIENLTGLRVLVITNNDVTDLGPLSGLNGLHTLRLNANRIANVGPLGALSGLRTLTLRSNSVSDVTPLGSLTGLEDLDLRQNDVADIAPLSSLTSLEELSLSRNPVADFEPLKDLVGLRSLRLTDTGLSDLRPLSGLTGLTLLWASSNAIADLGPLSALTDLESLLLHENDVSDLTPLSGLTALVDLGLGANAITDIGALEDLHGLELVQLFSNSGLSDIGPLLRNPGIGTRDGDSHGDQVNLVQTSVPCSDVKRLVDEGVTVITNCP